MKTAHGVQVAPGDKLASTVKEGMVVYDDTANTLKLCDGTNWVSIGSGGGGTASAVGAAGYVQFSDGAGSLAYSGTTAGQQLFWDNTNKMLGIGTATPQHPLHVVTSAQIGTAGTGGTQDASVNFGTLNGVSGWVGDTGTKGWTMFARGNAWSTAADQNDFGLSYWTGSAWYPALAVDSATRNTGLGVITSPLYPLHIADSMMLGQSGVATGVSTSVNLGTLNTFAAALGSGTTKGWSLYGRSDAYTTTAQQNDFGLSFWDGSAWQTAFTVDSLTRNLGIGTATPAATAALDVTSTTKGFLPPRMTTAQRTAISSPATGLVVYDTDLNSLYIKTASAWAAVGASAGSNSVYFRGYRTSAQSIPHSTWTTLITPEITDVGGDNYNPATGVFTAPVAGFYQFNAQSSPGWINPGTLSAVLITANGGTGVCQSANSHPSGSNLYGEVSCSGAVYLNVGGTALMQVYHAGTGGAVNINGIFTGGLLGGGSGGGGSTTLAALTDVDVDPAPTDGQALIWNNATSKWEPGDVSGNGDQTGMIAAFAATSCPSGWTEYVAARGRFLRGIDPSGSTAVDPRGTVAPGTQQADAFKSHTHTKTQAVSDPGTNPDVNYSARVTGANLVNQTMTTDATGGNETRPVNVAVIFCEYQGTGGGGGGGGSTVAFHVHKNGTNQTVTANAVAPLTWSTEAFDTNNNFDTGTGRFTPTVAGKYVVTVNVVCNDATAYCQAILRKNGSVIASNYGRSNSTNAAGIVTSIVDMNGSSDYLDAAAWNSPGTTIGGSITQTYFTGALLGGGSGGSGTPAADSLNFTEFADAMILDASTDIAADGSEVFSLTNTGTAASFVVNDESSDASPFLINASGDVVVGGTTVDASAALEVKSSAKGFLPPRMTTAQRNAISSPATGLIVYDTDLSSLYIYTSSAWAAVGSGSSGSLVTGTIPAGSSGAATTNASNQTFPGAPTVNLPSAGTYFISSEVYYVYGAGCGDVFTDWGGSNITHQTRANKWQGCGNSGTTVWNTYHSIVTVSAATTLNPRYTWTNAGTSGTVYYGGGTYIKLNMSGGGGSATPGGSTGAIQFNNAGTLGGDDANFFWDATNKRLGIGTGAPSGPITVIASGTTGGQEDDISLRSYQGAGATTGPSVSVLRGRGTVGSPTTVLAGDLLGAYHFGGHNGTLITNHTANISAYAESDFSTNLATVMTFATHNGTAGGERMRITGNGTIGIGTATPAASSLLDVSSTTKGFLPPRMTTAQRTAISSPATGLVVYDTDLNSLYIKTASAWAAVGSGASGTPVAFSVHKNGTAQAKGSGGNVLVTWSTERFDTNNNFASSRFTPTVAGQYLISISINCTTGSTDCGAQIWKNGVETHSGYVNNVATAINMVTAVVDMNGSSDYIEAYVYSGGATSIVGAPNATFFTGALIGGGGSGGGGSTTLAALTDVNVGTPSDGQALTYNNGTSKWVPTTLVSNPAAQVAFSVNKNGTSQTVAIGSEVKLTWPNEVFDTNNNFASDRFTPTVAGKYFINASAYCQTATAYCLVRINKNGVTYASNGSAPGTYGLIGTSAVIDMNGSSDYLEVFVNSDGNTINGGTPNTFFNGFLINGGGGSGTPAADSLNFTEFADAMILDASTDIAADGSEVFSHTNIGTAASLVVNDEASDASPFLINASGDVVVGGTTVDASAALEIKSSAKGFLPPRMTTAQRTAISSPATGLVVYDTDLNSLYIKTASAWAAVGSGSGSSGAGFFVHRNGVAQTVTSSTPTLMDWTHATFNQNSDFNLTSNRFVASVAGTYIFTAHCVAGGGYMPVSMIYKNGTNISQNNNDTNGWGETTTVINMAVNDYAEAWCQMQGGTSVTGSTNATFFAGGLLGGGSGGGGSTTLAALTDVNVGTPTDGQALTWNNGSSKWVPTTLAAGSASQVVFRVHRNGTTQTGLTTNADNVIDWTTEAFDTNNNFNLTNDRFTPTVAGKYIITLNTHCVDNGASNWCVGRISKNGTSYATSGSIAATGGGVVSSTTAIVDMNGSTDYIQGLVYNGGGTQLYGTVSETYMDGALINGGGGGSASAAGTTGGIQFNGGSSAFAADNTNFFWDDTNNRLGIGTATPNTPLEVAGSSATADSKAQITNTNATAGNVGFELRGAAAGSAQYIDFTDSSTSNAHPGAAPDFRNRIISNSSSFVFQSNTSTLMVMNNNGNIGVGVTPAAGPKLQIEKGANTHGLFIGEGTAPYGATMLQISAAAGYANYLLEISKAGSSRMYLQENGLLWIASTITQNSDERLKKDIHTIPGALDKLSAINGVTFHWKDPERGKEEQMGVIAQNVEAQFPQLVNTDKEGMKSVNYPGLVAPLIEAVKELKAANDTLRAEHDAELKALRAEIEALKAGR